MAGNHTEEQRDDAPGEEEDPRDIRRVRIEKVHGLAAAGIDPYPHRFDVDHTVREIHDEHGSLGAGIETDERVQVAGRAMLLRGHGKLVFATLADRTGEIQLFVSKAVLGDEAHERFVDLDRGDWIGVEGTVMTTRKGELSIKVDGFELLSKALRPLPDKWHGLSDVETRFRQRYVDLVVNPDARRVFEVRSATIRTIREHLDDAGFLEVETPMLNLSQGGATARPFITHYNALDLDSYLRIALELHHKRLLVGGLERVYEIGRIFRNEGIDARHNPEFTMLEAYQAFADYEDMMALTETLIRGAASAALDTLVVDVAGTEIDLGPPFERAAMASLASSAAGTELHPSMDVGQVRRVLDDLGLEYEDNWGSGRLVAEVYDRMVEDDLIGPIFVTEYPVEISPLAKVPPHDPSLVARFELIIGGNEVANAYSELNDPVDQLSRFEREAEAKAAGDPEAGDVDYDYVRALEYGMPPAGGLGIGIDRLVMLLAGVTSIREVIYFPMLRPESLGADDFGTAPGPRR